LSLFLHLFDRPVNLGTRWQFSQKQGHHLGEQMAEDVGQGRHQVQIHLNPPGLCLRQPIPNPFLTAVRFKPGAPTFLPQTYFLGNGLQPLPHPLGYLLPIFQ
jgi:hypothetical protein